MSRKLKPEPKVAGPKKKPPRWRREKNITRFIWIAISVVILLIIILVGYWGYDNYVAVWNEPVAKVNDATIDTDYYVKMLRFYARNPDLSSDIASLPSQVLRILENNELIAQFAPEIDISVSDEEIAEEIENFLSPQDDNGNSTQSVINIEDLYRNWLERVQLSAYEYERLVETDLLFKKVEQYLHDNEVPTETEQVHLHLIAVDDEVTASTVYDTLNTGGNFTVLALQYCTIEELKNAGGDVGFVPRGIYTDLDDIIFSLEVGNITEPIQVEQGYFIAMVTEKVDSLVVPEEYRDILADGALANWTQANRDASIIEEYLDQKKINWAIDQIT